MKTENRITISAMPWQAGLTNAGGQTTIDERGLWEARNVESDPTGRLSKRRGLRFLGQQLNAPTAGGYQWSELFSDSDNWAYAYSGTSGQVTSELTSEGLRLETKASNSGTSSITYNRTAQAGDGTVDTSNKFVANFLIRADTAFPAQDSDTAIDAGLAVHCRSDHANILTLLFLASGIYYYNGAAFTLVSETDIDDGAWHKVQVRMTSATAATLSIDDEGSLLISSFSTYADVSVGANQVAISATTNDNDTYAATVNLVQYRDGTTANMSNSDIRIVKYWASGAPETRHMLVASKDLLYDDKDHKGKFTALSYAPGGDLIAFSWLSELLICGSAAPALRWNGADKPGPVPLQMPQNITAGAAYQGRVYASTAYAPRTVFFSEANDLSKWTTSDADGYEYRNAFDIPDASGGSITAMVGDYYGLLIIFTERSVWLWRSSGDPYNDGVLTRIANHVGCVGPRAWTIVGKDIVFCNEDGVYSLATVQEYGDVQSANVSRGIAGLWQHDNWIDQRKIIPNKKTCMIHVPNESRTYFSSQRSGQSGVNSLYAFQHDTGMWLGPMEFDSTLISAGGGDIPCIDFAKLGDAHRGYLVVASSLGDIAYLGGDRRSDYPSSANGSGYPIQMYLRSARLDGRSVSPEIVSRYKNWRNLRLYVLPRDGTNIKVTWNVDGKEVSESATRQQNVYKEPLLSTTFQLGVSKLGDPERVGVLHYTLDTRGRWLEFIVEIENDTVDDNKHVVILGWEIDALVGGDEKEE